MIENFTFAKGKKFTFLYSLNVRRFVNVQHAVEVVELVTNRAGKKALGFHRLRIAVSVLIGHRNFHRAGNDSLFRADGKTAFPTALFPFLRNNFGVNQFKIPLPLPSSIFSQHRIIWIAKPLAFSLNTESCILLPISFNFFQNFFVKRKKLHLRGSRKLNFH